MTREPITSACPACGTVAERETYDIGSGPELSCANCEWCWGAEGQHLKPLYPPGPRNVQEMRRWAQRQGLPEEIAEITLSLPAGVTVRVGDGPTQAFSYQGTYTVSFDPRFRPVVEIRKS